MFELSETENRIQKFKLGRLLLKFYNSGTFLSSFSVICINFLISAHIEMLITAKIEIFFPTFSTDKLFKSIPNIMQSLISIINV